MSKINVLIVDDDFINLKLLSSMLKKNEKIGLIYEAKNGEEALAELKEHSEINMILLDILMPIMNGIELLKIMRGEPDFQDIPVIVLSTDETRANEALNVGANDFLSKPIRESILKDRIEKFSVIL